MRSIYVILHGQVRDENIYKRNISLFNTLKRNNIIVDVIVSTWVNEHSQDIKKQSDFIYLEYPHLEDTGHGNWIAQMNNYEHAIKYVRSITKDLNNTFVFKGRPDALLSETFIKHILRKPLIIENVNENNIFKHKIWVPWAELTKPMYIGDEVFFGHIIDMEKMYNYNEYDQALLGQGVTHIRRFIDPFIKRYPILSDYVNDKQSLTINMMIIPDFKKLKTISDDVYNYFIELMRTYYYLLSTYFDVESLPDHILFRNWSNYKQDKCVNMLETFTENNKRLCNISKKMQVFGKEVVVGNLKVMYSNECVNRVKETINN